MRMNNYDFSNLNYIDPIYKPEKNLISKAALGEKSINLFLSDPNNLKNYQSSRTSPSKRKQKQITNEKIPNLNLETISSKLMSGGTERLIMKVHTKELANIKLNMIRYKKRFVDIEKEIVHLPTHFRTEDAFDLSQVKKIYNKNKKIGNKKKKEEFKNLVITNKIDYKLESKAQEEEDEEESYDFNMLLKQKQIDYELENLAKKNLSKSVNATNIRQSIFKLISKDRKVSLLNINTQGMQSILGLSAVRNTKAKNSMRVNPSCSIQLSEINSVHNDDNSINNNFVQEDVQLFGKIKRKSTKSSGIFSKLRDSLANKDSNKDDNKDKEKDISINSTQKASPSMLFENKHKSKIENRQLVHLINNKNVTGNINMITDMDTDKDKDTTKANFVKKLILIAKYSNNLKQNNNLLPITNTSHSPKLNNKFFKNSNNNCVINNLNFNNFNIKDHTNISRMSMPISENKSSEIKKESIHYFPSKTEENRESKEIKQRNSMEKLNEKFFNKYNRILKKSEQSRSNHKMSQVWNENQIDLMVKSQVLVEVEKIKNDYQKEIKFVNLFKPEKKKKIKNYDDYVETTESSNNNRNEHLATHSYSNNFVPTKIKEEVEKKKINLKMKNKISGALKMSTLRLPF